MRTSFTAEHEAQLTAWGCPLEMMNPQPPPGKSIATDATLAYHPRHPHDVLAWLNDRFDAANSSLDVAILVASSKGSTASKITAYNGIIERQPSWDFTATDSYSAVYALAQAVMESDNGN